MERYVKIKHLLLINVGFFVFIFASFFVYRVMAAPDLSLFTQSGENERVSYQGTLTDSFDNPIEENLNIVFRIYTQPNDGAAIWEEAHINENSVSVVNGLFNVELGSLNPIDNSIWSEPDLYLGIQIGEDLELSPRDQINLMPARITAGSLDADVLKPFDLGFQAFPSYWVRHGEGDGEIQLHNKVTGENTILYGSTCPSDNTWCCNSENTICVRKNPSGDDNLAIRLEESHSLACWLVHDEDDNPANNEGLKVATNDYGSNPFGDNIPTFYFLRDGYLDLPIDLYASYFILCLNDAQR